MTEQSGPNYPISSADNVLRVLLMFHDRDTLRVTEVSETIQVAHSTAHRLLAMLVHRDLVHHDSRRRTYHPGLGLVALAHSVLRHNTIGEMAQPILNDLVDEVGETAHLTVLRGPEVMFVAVAESTQAVRAAARTGTTLPAHLTAAGRAVLACLPARELDTVLDMVEAAGHALDRSEVDQILTRVRQMGYAINRAETEPDLWAVAAPVRRDGTTFGAITVGCPATRAGEGWVQATGPRVIAAAERLADRLTTDARN